MVMYVLCTPLVRLRRYFSLITLQNKLKNTFPANISRILRNQLDKSAIDIPFRSTEFVITPMFHIIL